MSEAIRHYTNEFRARRDVSPYDAEVLFEALISESDVDLLTDFLIAWTAKGTTEDELFRFTRIMRERMKTIETRGLACVDIVGTGGSRAKTFNVSTAAAFVVAGAGIPVAKHGNRAATSSSGSADVLSSLGIAVDVEPAVAEANLHSHGICFMFAPRHHSLSRTLSAARKRVGSPTIFNNLGPLCNPAAAPHQLIGVWDPGMIKKTARVMQLMGTEHSWVVHGLRGLDEIALHGETRVAGITGGAIREFNISVSTFGIEAGPEPVPTVSDATQSADIIEKILNSKLAESSAENIVLINAAAAIHLVKPASDPSTAFITARESIRSGAALDKLNRMRQGAK